MTSNHPYPEHVVEAIHDRLQEAYGVRDIPVHVEEVLEWLWDASRVDTMEQVEQLPDHSFLIDEGGCCIAETPDDRTIPAYLPAHVIFWGESND